MENLMMDELPFEDDVSGRIMALEEVIIYGAGVMGHALKLCLEAEPYKKMVSLFIVGDAGANPESIGDTPVIAIDAADTYKGQTIIVALNETNLPGAVKSLREAGFDNLIELNAAGDEWANIKANYFLCNQEECYIPFKMLGARIEANNG